MPPSFSTTPGRESKNWRGARCLCPLLPKGSWPPGRSPCVPSQGVRSGAGWNKAGRFTRSAASPMPGKLRRRGCLAWVQAIRTEPASWLDARSQLYSTTGGTVGMISAQEATHLLRLPADSSGSVVEVARVPQHAGFPVVELACTVTKPPASERHRDSSTGVPSRNPYILLVFRVGTTSASGFTLSALAPAHRDYVSIRNQFDLKWIKHGAPMVLHILKLEVPAAVSRSFFNYSQTSSNVKRRFHGTGCSARCNFFADLKGSPCEGMDCRVCSICTCGFKINGNVGTTARRTSISLRYGEGLYFSSVSGKANDYAAFSEKNISGRRLRCMFVANVCAGKAYSTMQGSLPQNMCPPANYDSVVGEAGQALNHDELVVYKEEAALPTHLIVYSLP